MPVRWPAGEFWASPRSLDLLTGTPFNCLVLPWSAHNPEVQFTPLIEAGRSRGLQFACCLEPEAAHEKTLAAAKSASLEVIPLAERAKIPWQSPPPVIATSEAEWPAVRASSQPGAAAEAGPTGLPWIDSNGWFARLAATLAPRTTLWLAFQPPKDQVLRPNSYLLAVADSAVYGARWIASLDAKLADGLAAGNSQSLDAWRRIARAAAFFEKRREWREYRPPAILAVLSDFRGDNEFLAGEALNLLARRQLPCAILEKSKVALGTLSQFKAILSVDREPPETQLRAALLEFVRAGGLLLCQPSSGHLARGASPLESHPRFHLHKLGKGRIAIAREEMSDPYVLAADAHLLLSRRHDLYRTWNSIAVGTYYTVSAGNSKAVFHILNYAGWPAAFLAVRIHRPYRQARLWKLDSDEPAAVKMITDGNWTEFHLPAIFVYAALELET